MADGKAYCWGLNTNGQLGDNSTTQRTTPVAVDDSGVLSGRTVTAISAGDAHACIVARDSMVYCWGDNSTGELGNGESGSSIVPKKVRTIGTLVGNNITKISLGESNNACAVVESKAYCWGDNLNGAVGAGKTSGLEGVPVAVDDSGVLNGKTVIDISTSKNRYSCAVADGKAYCWGLNANGQLGDNSVTQRTSPVAVDTSGVLSGKTVTAISAGDAHTCAVADGKAYCWGLNTNGQLGDNSVAQRTSPVAVDISGVLSGKTVTAVSAGTSHTCAVADGKAYCWGLRTNGRLGDGSSSGNQTTPATVTASGVLSGKTVTAVSAGTSHTCAVADGKAYCWGLRTNGRLGDGSSSGNQTTPATVTASGVLSGKTVTAISAGTSHTCAVADGKAYCWGLRTNGRLGDGSSSGNQTTPVAVDTSGALASQDVSNVSSAGSYTCALAEGRNYCWGNNNKSLYGNGLVVSSLTPVNATVLNSLSPSSARMNIDQFELQYAKRTATTCSVQATGFAKVTTTSAIAYATNSGVTNNAEISSYAKDPFESSLISKQSYRSANGPFSNINMIPDGQIGLFDMSLKDNGADQDTHYCLRVVYDDGTLLEASYVFPEIITAKPYLSVDVVDSDGGAIVGATFSMNPINKSVWCQQPSGGLGISDKRVRITNTTSQRGWNLTMSATDGPTAYWQKSGGGTGYDYNDPSGSPPGCNSGADGDGLAGQLRVNASASTISPSSGCTSGGISKNSLSAFNQGVTDSIGILNASNTTDLGCYWDLTGVELFQQIPSLQDSGSYSLDVTMTVTAS